MKVAIVHDVLVFYGGAERVLENLQKIYPDAELFTFCYNIGDKNILKKFDRKRIHNCLTLKLSKDKTRFLSLLKLFALIYFYSLRFDKYDLVISSSSSYNAKFLKKGDYKHICYLHTTPKYLYGEFNEMGKCVLIFFWPVLILIRLFDKKLSNNVDIFVTNSNEVKKRLAKYLKKDSVVIYPPVRNISRSFSKKKTNREYYIFHSRLVRQKGLELVVNTAIKYRFKLLVIGEGYLREQYRNNLPGNIEFLGWVEDKLLPKYYSKTKALIYASIDEDFGIVPVEAMSMGVPVIAYKCGGVKETLVDGQTGYFYSSYNEESLMKTLKKLEKNPIEQEKCIERSRLFSEKIFEKNFKLVVNRLMKSD